MRTISIIGAGHSGLLLGLGLLEHGYDVTIVSDRTPGQVRRGFVPSSAGISPDAQAFERELGVNFWDDVLVPSDGVHFEMIVPGGTVALSIDGPWNPEKSPGRQSICGSSAPGGPRSSSGAVATW